MVKKIELSKGYEALVDDADFDNVSAARPWHAVVDETRVYARKSIVRNGRWESIRLHTFITGWAFIDHINGNGLDNRRENLRPCTAAQNAANRALRRDARTGFKGVRAKGGKWLARIQASGVRRHLGSFETPEDAAKAYDAAAIESFGQFARLNFPKEQIA
jgi:hypothetical protein